jgi:hypothetical protein
LLTKLSRQRKALLQIWGWWVVVARGLVETATRLKVSANVYIYSEMVDSGISKQRTNVASPRSEEQSDQMEALQTDH